MSQKHTFDRLVDFPTPFTPTNVILYGILCWFEVSGAESFVRIDKSRSVDVLGVKIRVNDVDSAARTALLMPEDGKLIRVRYNEIAERCYFENCQLSDQPDSLLHLHKLCLQFPSPHSSSSSAVS